LTKRGLWFSLFLLLFFQTKLLARVEIFKQCTTICVTDSEGTECVTKCEFVFVDTGEGGGNNGDIGNNDDTDNDDHSGGGSGEDLDNINPNDIDGDGIMDCWKKLTGSSRITEQFGNSRNNGCGFHTGLDIGTALEGGELPLHSATSGTIIEIGYQSSAAGYFIRVQNDDGTYTVYCHLKGNKNGNNISIEGCSYKIGDHISPGDIIGTTDSSPNVAPHLDIKFYFKGTLSLQEIQQKFPYASLESDDVRSCTVNGEKRTYVNPEKILDHGNCN